MSASNWRKMPTLSRMHGIPMVPPGVTANVPVQRRAAQRTVRGNRLLGVRGPLVPQNNMGGLLRRCKFNAFVSQSPQVNAFEQSLSTTEQDRCDSNVQLIDKAVTDRKSV